MNKTEPYIVIVRYRTVQGATWPVVGEPRYTSKRKLSQRPQLVKRLSVQYNGMRAMFSND